MKLLRCEASNFGSYDYFEFNFTENRLALVYGPTGSGKSTIPDIVCWALTGQTAKGGGVDEIKAWDATGPTTVNLMVQTQSGVIGIFRVRGKTPGQNDFYWYEAASPEKLERGVNLLETQKFLEQRLGITSQVYLMGAYFNEFSLTKDFFTAKAKDRRQVLEEVSNLSIAVTLAEKTAEIKKDAKTAIRDVESELGVQQGSIGVIKNTINNSKLSFDLWEKEHQNKILKLTYQSQGIDAKKKEAIANASYLVDAWEKEHQTQTKHLTESLSLIDLPTINAQITEAMEKTKCSECGAAKDLNEVYKLKDQKNKIIADTKALRDLNQATNPHLALLKQAKKLENNIESALKNEKEQVNPFTLVIEQQKQELFLKNTLAKTNEIAIEQLQIALSDYSTIYDLSFVLRGRMLDNAIQDLQFRTNKYLEDYFDSEFKVIFSLPDTDKLEVEIQKNGHICTFRQLSKGQRGILKLAFSVAIMKTVSNTNGMHFSNLFFDESLDGLDSDLKIKAFRLFQELSTEHDTVFVIDHSPEFQNLFDSKYRVELIQDVSHVHQE